MPKIIRALSADVHLVVSLLHRETVRSCGGVNGAELPMLCQRSGEKNGTGCAIVIPSPVTLLQLPPAQGFTPIPRRNAMTASANLFTFFESPVARTRTGSTPEIPLSSDQHLPHLSQNCVLRDFTLDSVRYSGVYLAKNSILSDVVG
ncbi:TPA: hypothetical protein ACNAB8_004745 [Escherichia coli]